MHTESVLFFGSRRLPPLVTAAGAGIGLLTLLAYAALHPAAPRLPAAPPAEPGVVRFAPESPQLSLILLPLLFPWFVGDEP